MGGGGGGVSVRGGGGGCSIARHALQPLCRRAVAVEPLSSSNVANTAVVCVPLGQAQHPPITTTTRIINHQAAGSIKHGHVIIIYLTTTQPDRLVTRGP